MEERSAPRAPTAAALFVLTLVLLGASLSRFGIWDPWEIDAADAGRTVASRHLSDLDPGAHEQELRTASRHPWLRTQVIALGFRLGGASEWSGRAGLALSGALAVLLLYLCVARLAGERAGVYAAICLASTPLFYVHSVLMMGDITTIFSLTAIWSLLALALWGELSGRLRALSWALGGVSVVLGLLAHGALVGMAVPLGAVVLAAVMAGDLRRSADAPERALLLGLCAVAAIGVGVLSVWMTTEGGLAWVAQTLGDGDTPVAKPGETWAYMLATGGVLRPQALATFDVFLEQVMHGMFPWSIMLPLALAGLGVSDPARPREVPLRLLAAAAMVLTFAAEAFLSARVGVRPFGAVAMAAVAIALWLVQLERSTEPRTLDALVAGAVAVILVRDFLLYPDAPLRSLSLEGLSFPEGYRVGRAYAPAILAFGLGVLYILIQSGGSVPRRTVLEIGRGLLREVRERKPARVAAFALGAVWIYLAISAVVILGQWSIAPWSMMTRLGQRAHLVVLPLPLGLALGLLGYRAGWHLVWRAGSRKVMLLPAVAVLIALWGVHGLLPRLGQEFSARQVFDTFERVRRPGEKLGEFHTASRSASYYSEGEVEDLTSATAVATFLAADERRFLVFPEKDLGAVTSALRARTHQHLRVLDDRSSRLFLGSNRLGRGERDLNPLRDAVLDRAPRIQHRIEASFQRKIDYLGYDLAPAEVGAGEEFTITYHFRCNQRPPAYKMFVHIDGEGARLNGDHDPVDGRYPLRNWAPGDYIVDRQTLRVPAHFRPGDYTVFMGFFEGERRMEVVEGPADDVNRVRGGTIRVR